MERSPACDGDAAGCRSVQRGSVAGSAGFLFGILLHCRHGGLGCGG
jgi:hypothetical protein